MSEDVASFKIKNREIKSVHQVLVGTEILMTDTLIPVSLNENNSLRFGFIE